MHFWTNIEFTKILGQFKQKQIIDLFLTCNYKFLKNLLNLKFIIIYIYYWSKYFNILITSPKTHCRIISFFKIKNVKLKLNFYSWFYKKTLLMLIALFVFAKKWKFITRKPLVTSLLFILNSQKNG